MLRVAWLTRRAADVPAGDGWLTERERELQAALRGARRRADWRLGRLAAKHAVGAWLGAHPARVEVLAAPDGAPEAWLDGRRAPVALSLGHRAGRALAAVCGDGGIVGCDLEPVEPRDGAFVREWLAPSEQALVAGAGAGGPLVASLVWTGKEAAGKVWRGGLRLDLRAAVVAPVLADRDGWAPVAVTLGDARLEGWWRRRGAIVLTVLAAPAPAMPERLP
jgi:4'-phosphopantetheinyl transferase